jgi:hypothetical protein
MFYLTTMAIICLIPPLINCKDLIIELSPEMTNAASLPSSSPYIPEYHISWQEIDAFLRKGGALCQASGRCQRMRSIRPRDMILLQDNNWILKPYYEGRQQSASFVIGMQAITNGGLIPAVHDRQLRLSPYTILRLYSDTVTNVESFCFSTLPNHMACPVVQGFPFRL